MCGWESDMPRIEDGVHDWADQIWHLLSRAETEGMTTSELATALQRSQTHTRKSIEWLKSTGEIRPAGKRGRETVWVTVEER